MISVRRVQGGIGVLVLLVVLAGCAAGRSQQVLHIAPVDRTPIRISLQEEYLRPVKTLAVLPLADSVKRGRQILPAPPFPEGSYEVDYPFEKDGEYLSDRIAAYLRKNSRFEVIGREEVARQLADQDISLSAQVDDVKASKIGRRMGVDAVLYGNVGDLFTRKKWKYDKEDYIWREMTKVRADVKVMTTARGRLGAIVTHELLTQNMFDRTVDVTGARSRPFTEADPAGIPSFEDLMEQFLSDLLDPIVEGSR